MDYTSEPSFRDLMRLLRKGAPLAIAVALLCALLTYVLSRSLDPTYRVTSTLLASQDEPEFRTFGASLVTATSIDVSAYRTATKSSPVVRAALEEVENTSDISREDIEALKRIVDVRTEVTPVSSLIFIDVENEDPVLAAGYANALATALLDWDRQRATRNLENIIETLEAQISAIDQEVRALQIAPNAEVSQQTQLSTLLGSRAEQTTQLNIARALMNSAVGRLEIVEPALTPLEPVAPRPLRNAALAFVLGIFLSYGLVLLRDALDTRIRSSDDLAQVSGLPILAEFPKQNSGRRLPAEASSYLRTNLLFATQDSAPKVILVTSSNSAQGKTSVSLSLAESFVKNDYRTLLVDADLRKPMLAKEYGVNALVTDALEDYLRFPDVVHEPTRLQLDNTRVLDFVPSFRAVEAASELLTRGFRQALDRWRQDYEVIIIDSAPILPVADTLVIAPQCTGVLYAVSPNEADRRDVQAGLELLKRIGVRVVGVVATNLSAQQRSGRERYGYGYGYGYGPGESQRAAAKAPPPNRERLLNR